MHPAHHHTPQTSRDQTTSTMGRWTQHDEDSHRLPEGVSRTGYDADTGRYSFRDSAGRSYQGEPYEEYGPMQPVSPGPVPHRIQSAPLPDRVSSSTGEPHSFGPQTFQDILRPNRPPPSSSSTSDTEPPPSPKSPHSRFKQVVRKATLPMMHGVVHNVMKRTASLRIGPTRTKSPAPPMPTGANEKIVAPGEKALPPRPRTPAPPSSYSPPPMQYRETTENMYNRRSSADVRRSRMNPSPSPSARAASIPSEKWLSSLYIVTPLDEQPPPLPVAPSRHVESPESEVAPPVVPDPSTPTSP